MHVGVEGESAVLHVKGERVNVEVAGADHFDGAEVEDHAVSFDMHIRHRWGRVFLHTVREETQQHISTITELCACLLKEINAVALGVCMKTTVMENDGRKHRSA